MSTDNLIVGFTTLGSGGLTVGMSVLKGGTAIAAEEASATGDIYYASTQIQSIYAGSTQVTRVYVGNTWIWPPE